MPSNYKVYIDDKDKNGNTALLMATKKTYLKTVQVLVDNGAGKEGVL